MRRIEIPHNSEEQVRGYLVAALALIDELEVPDALREPAFTKALDLLAAKNIHVEQVQPAPFGGLAVPPGRG